MLHSIRLAALGFGLLGICACNSEPDIHINSNTLTATLPDKIRQVARLGTVPLEVRVTINDTTVRQQRVPNDVAEDIQVTATVPADQSNNIKVEWLAVPNGTRVLLADYIADTQPNQETLYVSLYNDTGERFDYDDDGLSNLQEARENRNILGAFDIEVPFQTSFLGANIELIPGSVDPDLSGDVPVPDENTSFSLRHDGTNLFLYVCGQDEILQGDDVDTTGQYWHDDTIFIYLDGANSDRGTYDTIDDFQLAFVRQNQQLIVSKGSNNQFCPNGSCVSYRFEDPSTTTQCIYELSVELPLADLNMTRNTAIGFDLEINDDDNGGVRESSSGFVGFDDRSDLDPSTFATIRLE